MQSRQQRLVFAILAGIFAVLAGLAAMRSGFDFSKHETDMLHLVDIVLRLEAGARIHQDFMTPLGAWSVVPIVFLKSAGLGLGAAMKWGQILVAGLLLMPAWYVGVSRTKNTGLAVAFGASVLLLTAGLVYGGTDVKLSMSMHYNRWAWAIVFLPLALAILPAQKRIFWAEALIIGGAMAALVLIKVTYFVAFAPAVVLGLLLHKEGRLLGVSVAVGLGVLALQTALCGIGFWQGYIDDLLTVSNSEVRPNPGMGWAQVMMAPPFAVGTGVAFWSVWWLRTRMRASPVALILLVMLPGAVYVSYQNYGNDPIWLILWGLVLLVMGLESKARTLPVAGAIALAAIGPAALSIGFSPLRHVMQPSAVFSPLLQDHADLRGVTERFEGTSGIWSFDDEPDETCMLYGGAVAYFRDTAQRLEKAGFAGAKPYVAGLFNTFWLFGDFKPLKGGAPWYYGGLPGIEDADVFVLPECALKPKYVELVMKVVAERGVKLEPAFQDDLMAVYRVQLP